MNNPQTRNKKGGTVASAALNTVGSVAYFFLQWLTTVLAVRFANYEVAGVYALAISFTNVFYYLALFGIRNYQISDVAQRFSHAQYTAARLLTAAGASVSFLVAAWATGLSEYAFRCYLVYMVFKLGETFTDGYFALLQSRQEYGRLAVSYCVKALLSTAGFAVSLYFTGDLLTAIIAMTAGYAAAVLAVDLPNRLKMPRQVQFGGCGKILLQCLPLLLISLSVPVMNYVTRYAVEQVLDPDAVGRYASLSSVIVVMSTLAGAVFVVLIPEVSALWLRDERRKIAAMFGKVTGLMVAFGIVGVLAGVFLGPWVCSLIFGQEILESIDLLVPLIITGVMLMIKSFFSAMLIPLERRRILLAGEICGVVLCVATAMPLTRLWGMQGANLSYLAGLLLQAVILASASFYTVSPKGRKG